MIGQPLIIQSVEIGRRIISLQKVMSTSKFEACKQSGKYEIASPGEVCTIETAKRYGIANENGVIKPDYSDTKQFLATPETQSRTVCLQNKDGTKAYRHCVLEHGAGFVRKSTQPDKCVTVSCPPKWEDRRGKCLKPLEDYILSKRAHCDERWYDWFHVPNYHLGNKIYEKSPGFCYNPCPPSHVPAVLNDPVDGESAGVSATDKPDACANKADYFGGKYAGTSEYCPLVWIKRLASTPDVLRSDISDEFAKLTESIGGEANLNEHGRQQLNNMYQQSEELYRAANKSLENITYANEREVRACRTLATPERLQQAYETCKKLKEDPEGFVTRYKNIGESEDIINKKVAAIQQACNAVFCNPDEDSAQAIGKDALCFDNPPRIDGTEIPKVDPWDFDQKPTITSDHNNVRLYYIVRAFRNGFYFMYMAVLIVLIIYFILWFIDHIWPRIRCVVMKGLGIVGLVEKYHCRLQEELRIVRHNIGQVQLALNKKHATK